MNDQHLDLLLSLMFSQIVNELTCLTTPISSR